MLGQLGQEVQGIEQVDVLLEVLRVGRVKQDPPLERLVADLLQRNGRPRDVFSQTLLGGVVKNTDTVGMAEHLPFDENSVDYVLSVEASRAYSDVEEFFRQVRRVLKQDGRFLLTDMRRREDMEPLRAQLAESGFDWEVDLDISANVVRALERDNERKTTLMKQRIPKMFLSAFSEFAGTIGSGRYSDFRDGRMIYLSWCLKPVE